MCKEKGEQGSLPTAHREATDRLPLPRPHPRLAAHLSPGPCIPAPCHLTGPQAAGTHVRGAASWGTALLTGSCSCFLPTPKTDHRTSLDSCPTLG